MALVLRSDDGNIFGTDTIALDANGHASFMLNQKYIFAAGMRGTVEFDAPWAGRITVLDLRAAPIRGGASYAVTSVPALVK